MGFKTGTSNLSLRQLRAFLAVAQEASMTRAASQLHLTPSALSMLIRSMEDDLGFRLFERTTRRLVLSLAGRQLLPTVQQIFENLEQGIDTIRSAQQVKATQLAIAASPLLASTLVPDVISSFRQQRPHVRVKLIDVAVDSLPALVRDGVADIAICTADGNYADLRSTNLYDDKLMLACNVDHAFARRREVEWRELCNEPLILLRQGSGLRSLVDKAFSRWSKRTEPAYEVSQVATALGLVEVGEGVSILPSYAISRVLSAGRETHVATIALVAPVVRREIVALTRVANVMEAPGLDFIDHFKKVVA